MNYIYIMVNVDKLKELKKKLKTFKKVSQKDSEKGKILANEIIKIIELILKSGDLSDKILKNINLTKDTLKIYVDNLTSMDEIKKKWK